MISRIPRLGSREEEKSSARLLRAAILFLLGLCIATGAAISDIYLHRGIESGAESPVVLQPSGRDLATNVDLRAFSPDQLATVATVLQTNNFWVVRQPFAWSDIEPTQGTFDWARYDGIVKTLADRQINVVAVIVGTPDWARAADQVGYPDAPPVDAEDYGAFVAAMADHFRDQIEFIQLWDVPNQAEHWGGVPANPADYLRLLAAGFNGARGANSELKVILAEIDPVGIDGSFGQDLAFLEAVYKGGGSAFFDIMSIRIEGGESSPYDRKVSAGRENLSRAILFRELMVDHGDRAKPIWMTHYGWQRSDGDGGVSPSEQADFTVAGMRRARAEWPWLGLMFAWDLLPGSDPASVNLALLDANGAATPAFTELAAFGASGSTAIASTGFVPMDSRPVAYEGAWADQHLLRRTFRTSSETGATAILRFRGTGVTAILRRSRQAGPIRVTIDGEPLKGRPVIDGASVIDLDFYQAQDIPVVLADQLPDGDHELRIELADRGQLTIGGLVVSRDPPLLWPVILLLVVAVAMIFASLRDVAFVVARQSGVLQARQGIELRPPLPRLPDWRPAPRYR